MKWLSKFIDPQTVADAFNTFTNFTKTSSKVQIDIDKDSSFIYSRESELMTTDAKYTIKLICGRKVYEDEERQLPVWSKKDCDERMAKLFASEENHADFLMKMAEWAAGKKADPMEYAWAGDCLLVIHEAYDHAEQKSLEPKSEDAQAAPEPIAKQAVDKPKAKLFGVPKKPTLFARKENNAT